MKIDSLANQVQIVSVKAINVAVFEHRGDPRQLGASVRQFIEWRTQNNLSPRISDTFNILYDNPINTAPENYRFDICASTDLGVAENAFGVIAKVIPAGRCAVLRHVGSDATMGNCVNYLFSEWLPASGETLRDFPLYLQRVSFFPEVQAHEAVTDVFVPIE